VFSILGQDSEKLKMSKSNAELVQRFTGRSQCNSVGNTYSRLIRRAEEQG